MSGTMAKAIIGAIAVAFVVVAIFSNRPQLTPPKPQKTLVVGVAWNETTLKITNKGPDGIGAEMIIYLNGQPPFTYRADSRVPATGESVILNLRDFVKKDGERFNPFTHAVTEAWVGGGGFDYHKFGK